jgi:hypothetical protein
MDIPKNSQRPAVRSKNPITSDPALVHLLDVAKGFESEVQFNGWKDSFLKVYRQYLDPTGVENAHASDGRLLRSMEKLAGTVVSVKALVEEGKITAESQTVMGKRALTNMTDQMARTEKEIARFMPTTGAEEQMVGYDKFELGAVLIEDGFHVYELLKSTQAIVVHLQEQVLNNVLPNNKQSIIQFYLRQIQSFCDVMADLGLFGLMEDVMEMYKAKPRSKKKPVKTKPGAAADASPVLSMMEPPSPMNSQQLPEEEAEIVELDPDKIYNFRSSYNGGYKDPFSGTAPGNDEEPLKSTGKNKKDDEKGNDGEEDFLIYFDMKTGCIGKIPRSVCAGKSLIVSVNDAGEEIMDGEIEDDDEREQLLWDMKKAMKSKSKVQGSTGANGSRSPSFKSPGGPKTYVVTPKTGARRSVGNLRGLQAPRLEKDEDDEDKPMPSLGLSKVPLGKSSSFNVKDMPGLGSSKRDIKEGSAMSSINYASHKNDPAPSSEGTWVKSGLKKRMSDSATNRASIQKVAKDPKSRPDKDEDDEDKLSSSFVRTKVPLGKSPSFNVEDMPGLGTSKSDTREGNSMSTNIQASHRNDSAPSSDGGYVKPGLKKRMSDSTRASIQKGTKDPKPSNDGWTSASTIAASRRKN